jgi:hypothetical protein
MTAALSQPRVRTTPDEDIVIEGVEVFASGKHRDDAPEYTERDLDDMARNFRKFRLTLHPPVVLGHEEEQPLGKALPRMAEDPRDNTGSPAVGWITRLWRKGKKLFADFAHVHPWIADAVRRKLYRFVSAEVYDRDDPPPGVPAEGCVLRRVALLGGELPQVKLLRPLPEPRVVSGTPRLPAGTPRPRGGDGSRLSVPASIHRYAEQRLPGGVHRVFFEVSPMDRAAQEAQLKELGFSDDQIAALASLSDDDFTKFFTLTLAKEAGLSGGETPAPDAGAAPMAEFPEGMDRQSIIDWLVSQGEDQAALEAMSDDELIALYQERQGAAATPMSEPTHPDADEPDEDEPEEEEVPTPTTPTPPAPAPAAARRPAPKQITKTVKFSESDRRWAERKLAELVAAQTKGLREERAKEARARRLREEQERRKGVQTFCERMVAEGRVDPAEMDASDPDTPTLVDRLMRLDASRVVRKFSEAGKTVSVTALEDEMRAIQRRTPRRFAEKLTAGGKGGPGMTPEERARALAATGTGQAVLARERAAKAGRN